MEILGIGMSELIFILIIALLVLGPKDMQKAGKTIGRWLRSIVTSDGWKAFQQTSRELRHLPNRLIRDANEELNKIGDEIKVSDPTGSGFGTLSRPQRSGPTPPIEPETISPPAEKTEALPDESPKEDAEPNA